MKPFESKTFTPQPGITLIEASAGTGKTYSITEIVANLVESGQCAIDQILLLTFTNAATSELKDRIRNKLQESYDRAVSAQDSHRCEKLAQAIEQFDQAVIQTIHGFCQRILHEFSIDCGLSVEFEVLKEKEAFEESVRNSIIRHIQQTAEEQPTLLPFCSWLGFGKGYIEKLLLTPSLLNQIDDLPSPDSDQSFKRIDQSLALLCKHWQAEGEAITSLLLDSKTNPLLKKNYSDRFLKRSIRSLDQWGETGMIRDDLFTIFESFSIKSLQKNLKKNKTLPSFQFFETCGQFSESTTDLTFYVLKVIKTEADQHLERLNNQQNQLRYDDLLCRLESALQKNDSLALQLRNRFKVGLIDEFQDTDPTQFEILKRIFLDYIENEFGQTIDQRPLILIGDPKQAIYSFRGGDIFTYQEAKNLAKQSYFLSTNWRSTPAVNEGMNKLLRSKNQNPFVFSWLDYEPVHTAEKNRTNALIDTGAQEIVDCSGIHFIDLPKKEFSTQHSICKKVVEDVSELTSGRFALLNSDGSRQVKVSDIAILVPKNQLGAKIRQELSKAGIQAIISGGASVFASEEANHWYCILSAIQHPKKNSLLRGALCSPMFGYSAQDLMDIEKDTSKWSKIALDFAHSKNLWDKGRLGEALAHLSNHYEWLVHQSKSDDPERCLANSNHLLELILDAHDNNSFSPQKLIEWLGERMRNPNTSNESELLRLEIDTQSVCIQTLHKSKGLQYPIVLIPFSLDSNPTKELTPPFVYHADQAQVSCVYTKDQRSGAIIEQKANEILSEKLRLLYVGITRAEFACYVYTKTPISKNDALGQWVDEAELSDFRNNLPLRTFNTGSVLLKQEATSNPCEYVAPEKPPFPPAPVTNWSFTSMTRHSEEHVLAGLDELPVLDVGTSLSSADLAQSSNIFEFEKGTHAGLFFHHLIETTDLSSPSSWQSKIETSLAEYGYPVETWQGVMYDLLSELASIQLESDDECSKLGSISEEDFFKETEFTFPMSFDHEGYRKFKALFENQHSFTLPPVDKVETHIRGYMKGVIDLWLKYGDKIYLLDWKSNHLGGSLSDYAEEAINDAMNEHNYHLQYLIYLCAIKRYLSLIDPNLDFDSCFGGIYYVFLRGLDSESPTTGVFRYKPDRQLVEALNHCFDK